MNMQRAIASTALGFAVAALVGACSSSGKSSVSSGSSTGPTAAAPGTESAPPGDISDSQAFVAYSAVSHNYVVKVPEGWAMTQVGAAVVFTDKYNSIRIQASPVPAQPTISSARTSELPPIQNSASGFRAGDITTVTRSAGPAVLITYQADSSPNPVTGKVVVEAVERYEFWRNGTEIVITLSSPTGSDNVDPWRKVTDSFAWTP